MRGFATILTVGLAVALATSSVAEDLTPFTDAEHVNLAAILPPPPAQDSLRTKLELGEILTIQVTRTPAIEARAIADDRTEDVWRFADAIDNPKFTKENLPKFSSFMARVGRTAYVLSESAKKIWNRPRPYIWSDLVKPLAPLSKTGAYPSGHTTFGTLDGIVLSNMLPERRAAIMSRAWEYGQNRIVAGMHYSSDVEAGRIAGSVIAATIANDDDYKAEFEAAKAELRSNLGLPPFQ